jgi:hypothetical protein
MTRWWAHGLADGRPEVGRAVSAYEKSHERDPVAALMAIRVPCETEPVVLLRVQPSGSGANKVIVVCRFCELHHV